MEESKTAPTPGSQTPRYPEQNLNESTLQPQDQKIQKKLPLFKIIIIGVLGIITLLAFGLIAYLMMGQNKPEESQFEEISKEVPSSTPDPTADWKTYTNGELGFQIKYPHTTKDSNSEWSFEEFDQSYGNLFNLGFGPPESKSGGYMWGINIYAQDLESLINDIGDQFDDRKETRVNININGKDAILTTVTTDRDPDWIAKTVFIKKNNNIYAISNGAIDSPEFENFYKSFKFTDTSEMSNVNTSGWKTYNNPLNATYTLKYPGEWTIIEAENQIILYPSGYPFKAPGEPSKDNPFIKISTIPACGRGVNPINTEVINIDKTEYKKFYESNTEGLIECVTAPNNNFLVITFKLPNDTKLKSINTTYDQILSTLEFKK